jgi:hypothetical protein
MEACSTNEPAQWVVDRLGNFTKGVTSVIPQGYSAYLRVFHPFWMNDGSTRSWAEIAARVGRRPHPLMQLEHLLDGIDHGVEYDHLPPTGELPDAVAQVVINVLSTHTTTPELCYFAIWDGYGHLPKTDSTIYIPGQRMQLYQGPVSAAGEGVPGADIGIVIRYRPNIWWPADRAWCVATEIDLNSTYIGCDRAAAHDLLASNLEVAEVNHDDPITFDSGPTYA